jgi:hypothetical protein
MDILTIIRTYMDSKEGFFPHNSDHFTAQTL